MEFLEVKANVANFTNWFTGVQFILGASDPEMVAIEAAIRNVSDFLEVNPRVSHACFGGRPVFPGNAYQADCAHPVAEGVFTLCFIECAVATMNRSGSYVVDHHNPGDYGFDGAPETFWESSSIGQVYRLFQLNGCPSSVLDRAFGPDRYLAAASDHCPAHAAKGKCPGISPTDLMKYRAKVSSAFVGMTEFEWTQTCNSAVNYLKGLLPIRMDNGWIKIAEREVPLLNHASLFIEEAVQYTLPGNQRDPRTKVGLLGGSPELIREWMKSQEGKLVGIYGSPERGYAGGYLPE